MAPPSQKIIELKAFRVIGRTNRMNFQILTDLNSSFMLSKSHLCRGACLHNRHEILMSAIIAGKELTFFHFSPTSFAYLHGKRTHYSFCQIDPCFLEHDKGRNYPLVIRDPGHIINQFIVLDGLHRFFSKKTSKGFSVLSFPIINVHSAYLKHPMPLLILHLFNILNNTPRFLAYLFNIVNKNGMTLTVGP
jgi:hypothetical protein